MARARNQAFQILACPEICFSEQEFFFSEEVAMETHTPNVLGHLSISECANLTKVKSWGSIQEKQVPCFVLHQ